MQLIRNNMPFIFNNNYIKAFKELKNQLISSLILYYYNLDLKLILEINIFNKVVAGVLLSLRPAASSYKLVDCARTKVYRPETLK